MSSTSNLHLQSIPNLIDILRTSFRHSQYDEVAWILSSREKSTAEKISQITVAKATAEKQCSILESKCTDLENMIKLVDSTGGGYRTVDLEQMLKQEKDQFLLLDLKYRKLEQTLLATTEETEKYKKISDELQEKLDRATADLALMYATVDLDRTTKGLEEMYRKNNQSQNSINLLKEELRKNEQAVMEIEHDWFAAKGQAEKYQKISEGLQNELGCMTKDLNQMRENYKQEQNRMVSMQEELRKVQEVVAEFNELQLENENINLGKQKAEEETSKWKRMYSEVQAREKKLFNENLTLQARIAALEKKLPPKIRECLKNVRPATVSDVLDPSSNS